MKTKQALKSEHTVSVSVSVHSAPQGPRALELDRLVQSMRWRLGDGETDKVFSFQGHNRLSISL